MSRKVQLRFSWRPNLKDDGDNKFVEAAIHAAAVITTYNVADYRSPDLKPHGWTVMKPQEFLARYSYRYSRCRDARGAAQLGLNPRGLDELCGV